MRVRFTPTGRTQFLAAVAYIRRENPGAAARFRQRAEEALRRLERFPESGRVVPEFPDLPYREVLVSPYRFFYRVKDPWCGSSQSGMGHNYRKSHRHEAVVWLPSCPSSASAQEQRRGSPAGAGRTLPYSRLPTASATLPLPAAAEGWRSASIRIRDRLPLPVVPV